TCPACRLRAAAPCSRSGVGARYALRLHVLWLILQATNFSSDKDCWRFWVSPRSGRVKIAQRFSAGGQVVLKASEPVKRAAERVFMRFKSATGFSRPLRGLDLEQDILAPAINRWAIFNRPLHGLAL